MEFENLTEEERILYSEIEYLIIMWSNDGTKTAGTLTRQIMDLLIKKDSKQNNMSVLKENFGTIYDIIQELKNVGVDGETMGYILDQVGMEHQMLRQLMLTLPIEEIENLIEERKELK